MNEKTFETFEDELDAIRLSIGEEIKDMTPEEEVAYFRAQTEPVLREFGIKRSTLKPVQPRKRERVAV